MKLQYAKQYLFLLLVQWFCLTAHAQQNDFLFEDKLDMLEALFKPNVELVIGIEIAANGRANGDHVYHDDFSFEPSYIDSNINLENIVEDYLGDPFGATFSLLEAAEKNVSDDPNSIGRLSSGFISLGDNIPSRQFGGGISNGVSGPGVSAMGNYNYPTDYSSSMGSTGGGGSSGGSQSGSNSGTSGAVSRVASFGQGANVPEPTTVGLLLSAVFMNRLRRKYSILF